jgi:hypothetical protein
MNKREIEMMDAIQIGDVVRHAFFGCNQRVLRKLPESAEVIVVDAETGADEYRTWVGHVRKAPDTQIDQEG